MSDPARDRNAERGDAAAACGQVERKIEAIAALPIGGRVRVREYLHVLLFQNAKLRRKRRNREGGLVEVLLIGRKQRTLVHGQTLRSIKHLRGAQYIGIITLMKCVTQDEMSELIHENERKSSAIAHQGRIGCLDRTVGGQVIAQRDYLPPILPRIRITHGFKFLSRERTPRIGQERSMDAPLDKAGVLRRSEFGTGQIEFHELVSHP